MKILLKTLYVEDYDARFEEIGIASIAAYMRQRGYEVLLLGSTYQNVDYARIEDFQPDIVGLSVYARTKDVSYLLIDQLKHRFPSLLVCLGGYLATNHDTSMIKENKDIDFIIRGEGEVPFYNLLENLKKGCPEETLSLTYRKGNDVIRNKVLPKYENLNTYPMPSRDYLVEKHLSVATCFFSRGCTAGCHFCSTPGYWKKWRGRDICQITDEIKYLDSLGVRYLLIQDCSFENPGSNYERVTEIARAIKDLKLDIRYFAAFRAEFSRKMDEKIIKELKDSGLFLINIGIESGNANDLRLFKKPAKLEDNQRIIDLVSENNIGYKMGFMNFNTYTTFDNLRENIIFLKRNNQTWRIWHLFSNYLAYYGTKLFEKIKNENYLLEQECDKSTYSFAEKKVGLLFNYLTDHLSKVINLEQLERQLYLLDSFYSVIYEFYNKFAEEEMVVKPQEIRYSNALEKLSAVNAQWFNDLLDYFESENEFDYDYADNIVLATVNRANVEQILIEANTIKYDLLGSLYQNKKYEKWLVNSFYSYMMN